VATDLCARRDHARRIGAYVAGNAANRTGGFRM
jgi:hypothetical protein